MSDELSKDDQERWMESERDRLSRAQYESECSPAPGFEASIMERLEKDARRLDWLERQRSEHHAHRSDAGWNNPGVTWEVGHWVKCGTYDFPEELSKVSVRDAIDAEMDKPQNDPDQRPGDETI